MLMMFLFLALAAAIAAVIFLRPAPRRQATHAASDDFRAVSVTFDHVDACPAVRELAHHRFLCADAPSLPLAECTAANCVCRFERHADRRAGARRASETGVFERHFDGADQRAESRGRRAEDLGDEAPAEEADQFDPADTYYDFIAQTGIRPETGK